MSLNPQTRVQLAEIKRTRSPAYLIKMKRGIQFIKSYNLQYCKNKLKHSEIKGFVEYFAQPLEHHNNR